MIEALLMHPFSRSMYRCRVQVTRDGRLMCRVSGEAEAEIDHAADEQHPGPGIDVEAEFETAHPARQQDLREKGNRRADHADEEGGAGETPHQRGIAAVGKQRVSARDRVIDIRAQEGERVRTPGSVLGPDRSHKYLCAAAGKNVGGVEIASKEPLTFGSKKLTIGVDSAGLRAERLNNP